jgi:fermentation-respiration switch protein FrsA (DUF1100 family)
MAMAINRRARLGRQARRVATAAGVLGGGAAISTLGVSYYVARQLVRPNRPGPRDQLVLTPFEAGAEFEEVTFRPERGDHLLRGWWFPRPAATRVIIGCPGYRGSMSDLIGIATTLWRAGFNVFLFDYHGHGSGCGTPITLAYREMRDFFGALNYVHERVADARIGVLGYSMGAAVAIMGAARRPEVRAVIADSPFASHTDIVRYRVRRVLRVSGEPFATVADHLLPHIAGYRGSDVMPLRDVAAIAPRPLLIIHGTADTSIPYEHAVQVYAAAGEPKELWLAEGATHCGAYFLDRGVYCSRIVQFFADALSDTLLPIVRRAFLPSEEPAADAS